VYAAIASVWFDVDPLGLESCAEAIGQFVEIETIGGSRESGAEASIFLLEDPLDAGVPVAESVMMQIGSVGAPVLVES
jgi:hypothetical protein